MLAALRRLGWFVGLLAVGPASAQPSTLTVRVRWQPSSTPSVVGYRVYARTLNRVYGSSLDAGKPAPEGDGTMSYLVTDLDASVDHAFALRAYTSDGTLSNFSNEIMLRTSTPPPGAQCQTAAARRASILLGRGKLKWRWSGSASVPIDAFGDPTVGTSYRLAIYDAAGHAWSARVPGGGACGGQPCWRAVGATAFRYGSRDALPDGVSKVLLGSGGVGQSKIQLRGGGSALQLPTLPLTAPVDVQLQREDGGACWEAIYSTPGTNTADGFKAKSD